MSYINVNATKEKKSIHKIPHIIKEIHAMAAQLSFQQ